MTTLRTYGDVKDYARTIGVSVNELFADDAELFESVNWEETKMSDEYLFEQLAEAERELARCSNEMRVFRKYDYEIPERLSDEYSMWVRRYMEIFWKMS